MTSYFLSGFSQNQSPISGAKLVAIGLPTDEVSAEISSPSLISSPSSSYISNEMSTSSYVSSEMLEYIFGHVIVALAFGGLVVNTCALVSFNYIYKLGICQQPSDKLKRLMLRMLNAYSI